MCLGLNGNVVMAGMPEDAVEMELFVNHPWWPLKDWSGSVAEEITRQTGVKLKVTVAADANQLQLMIASGDLPEMIFTDSTLLKRLSDNNLCYSWNELIEQYAPDFAIDPIRKALYAGEDGKFYTVLNNFSTEAEWNAAKYA
jgi:putative aldouronate transport system substrate-binding protein